MECKSDCVFNIDGKCTRQSKKDITVTEKWKNDFKGFISRLSMPEDDFYGIMQYIDEVPNEERWIPISERLPEDSGTYLVTVHDGRKKRTTFAQYQKKLKNWVMTGARAYWCVKAWMPLPEPYREEGAE